MANGSAKRTRSERVAALRLPPGRWRRLLGHLRRNDVLLRLGLAFLAAVCLWAATQPWKPPLTYRLDDVPQHDILARVAFEDEDQEATQQQILRAQKEARYVFRHDPKRVENLQERLFTKVKAAREASSPDDEAWKEFQPAQGGDQEMKLASLAEFQQALSGNEQWSQFEAAIKAILAPLRERGMLKDNWSKDLRPATAADEADSNQREVDIYPVNQPPLVAVPVKELDATFYKTYLEQQLSVHFATREVAGRVFYWLRDRLQPTLEWDKDKTEENRQQAAKVKPVKRKFQPGQRLASAGQPLNAETLDLLKKERDAWLASSTSQPRVFARSMAMFGLVLTVFGFFGLYLFFRQPELRTNVAHLGSVLVLVVATVFAARWLSEQEWRPEIIPLTLCGLTLAIAYGRELALLAAAAVTVIVVMATGRSVAEFFVLVGATAAAVVMLNGVRSRIKLIQICTVAGVVACLLNVVLGVLDGHSFDARLMGDSVRLAFWTLVAGFLVTGLLPFIERLFGVLTDLSLLELSDASHPLLQELVRRAPGTYNHSINVGSLAEAAAEAIGARGLLVRVGAYFHDIGKMLKPGYFVENQGQGDNRHQSLMPAMSTLVIIAHVKDGADLARQNKIPEPIIDFIQQHHGTTLVEYFYRQASERSTRGSDLDGSNVVDESSFRYPGPKPQTKEAGILMLADAVESASRVLVEPTPARIESLVQEISRKRLLDGQFDECGLTLEEVDKIGQSLIKSLTAVYHGRVKYPDQESATA